MSTMRFGLPGGGFTHSAPVQARACSSCGYIHHFVDMGGGESAEALSAVKSPPGHFELADEPDAE